MNRHNPLRISFIMPGPGRSAVGGFKVVYEYANRLVEAGYEVSVLYPLTLNYVQLSPYRKCRAVGYIARQLIRGNSCKNWFKLDSRVKERWVLSLNECHVPEADIYVATAVETAYYLNEYNRPHDRSLYLIQNFEDWGMSRQQVINSYGMGFLNIAISDWLAEIIRASGNTCRIMKNGFDFSFFRYTTPTDSRFAHSLTMMYNDHPSKGCPDGFKAIRRLKEKFRDMEVRVFSKNKRPDWLEDWIDFYQLPDRETFNRIYNSSAVYLAPSLFEGWGLPVGEAMMCGCAVVCTDNPGFREMVQPGINGLMIPVGDVDGMVEKVSELFENPALRIELAEAGLKSIQSFTWDKSAKQFLDTIKEIERKL